MADKTSLTKEKNILNTVLTSYCAENINFVFRATGKKQTWPTFFCGHWKYSEPYCRIHCSVAFAICPASLLWKMLGSWRKSWGLSSKQDEPEPLKTNSVENCYKELLDGFTTHLFRTCNLIGSWYHTGSLCLMLFVLLFFQPILLSLPGCVAFRNLCFLFCVSKTLDPKYIYFPVFDFNLWPLTANVLTSKRLGRLNTTVIVLNE